jgi:hypothetical protein
MRETITPLNFCGWNDAWLSSTNVFSQVLQILAGMDLFILQEFLARTNFVK